MIFSEKIPFKPKISLLWTALFIKFYSLMSLFPLFRLIFSWLIFLRLFTLISSPVPLNLRLFTFIYLYLRLFKRISAYLRLSMLLMRCRRSATEPAQPPCCAWNSAYLRRSGPPRPHPHHTYPEARAEKRRTGNQAYK